MLKPGMNKLGGRYSDMMPIPRPSLKLCMLVQYLSVGCAHSNYCWVFQWRFLFPSSFYKCQLEFFYKEKIFPSPPFCYVFNHLFISVLVKGFVLVFFFAFFGGNNPLLSLFFLTFFYRCSVTVVCIFSPPLHPTPAKPTSLSHSTLPLGFVHVSFVVVPENPSPQCSFPTPLWLLLDCS